MRKYIAWLVAGIFLIAACPAFAADLDQVLNGIKGRYGKVKDMKADFTQESMVKSLGRKQVKSGVVMFKKPDKMRWDYQKPEREELLTDGYTLWVYQPDDKVVYMNKLDTVYSAKVPMQILSGQIDVKTQFDVKLGTEKEGLVPLLLKPKKKDAGYEKAILRVSAKDWEIKQIDVYDLYGNVTNLTLTNTTFNNGLKDSIFVYTPKEGVKVQSAPVIEF